MENRYIILGAEMPSAVEHAVLMARAASLHSETIIIVNPYHNESEEEKDMRDKQLMMTMAAASMLAGDTSGIFNPMTYLNKSEQTVASMRIEKLLIEYKLIQNKVSKLSSRERALICRRVERMLSVEELAALKSAEFTSKAKGETAA